MPSDWNKADFNNWNKRLSKTFDLGVSSSSNSSSVADVAVVREFLEKRSDPHGNPVSYKLGNAVDEGNGWSRLPYLDFDAHEEAGLQRAWHGCKFEALYSILFHGRLIESRDPGRTLGDVKGVYMHKDATKGKAEGYGRFVQLCADGIFWAAMWEVRVDWRILKV
jgi:hypothetical protein